MSKSLSIATVVGARPQFIKAAPVSRALHEAGLQEILIHTGQHSDTNMSEVFFNEMELRPPDYFLGISGLSHGAMTGEMLKQIEVVLQKEKPGIVLVYGDTNSTFAGALAAAKLHIPVAHIESGLRSFNMKMPEEINRVLTDRVSKWLFCPTKTAIQNLKSEGYSTPHYNIENVGDVMYDATLFYKEKARWPQELPIFFKKTPFVLCTIHRQESTDDRSVFEGLLTALEDTAKTIPVVWPVHPRAMQAMTNFGLHPKKLTMIPPIGYLEMLALLGCCTIVATDSGGLQKEAYFFGKHCLILRKDTEWVELVSTGSSTLCGLNPTSIVKHTLERVSKQTVITSPTDLFGNGTSAKKIANILFSHSSA